MSALTPEKLAELRRLLDEAKRRLSSPRRAGKTYAMEALRNAAVNALPALLDAAAERDDLSAMKAERDALAAAVERVRELHKPEGIHRFCSMCAYRPWPCPTIRALNESETDR